MSLLLAVIMIVGMCSLSLTAFAAGSAQLNTEDDGYRLFTEYMNTSTAGLIRKTFIKCYLFRGETAYFGSSVTESIADINGIATEGVTGIDIVMTTPDSERIPFDVTKDGVGFIANLTQERSGPQITEADAGNTDKYQPLSYTAEEEGIYTFEFFSKEAPNHANYTSSATPVNNNKNRTVDEMQQQPTVAYWDITVADSSDNIKPGRIWTTQLSIITGNSSVKTRANLQVYVLTNDGFIYRVKFKKIVPFGFIFFANNQGFTTTGLTPYSIYHSFYDNDNSLNNIETEEKVSIHKPYMADTETAQSYKIFFQYPSSDLIGKVFNEPKAVSNIANLAFNGQSGGLSHYKQGGYFTFDSQGAASASITIDFRDSLSDLKAEYEARGQKWTYTGSGIIEMRGAVVDGENSFYWDGLDSVGQPIPVGVYGKDHIHTYSEAKGGEVHFPFIDVEGLYGGVEIERLNGEFLNEDDKFDIYYNNNPLKYNTIEGENVTPDTEGAYANLSDGTKSWFDYSAYTVGPDYFNAVDGNPITSKNISTLVKDTAKYTYNLKYGEGEWDNLTPEEQDEFEAEFETFTPKYHHEPNDSRYDTVLFSNGTNPDNNGNKGGGNQAGIDIWTYYSAGICSDMTIKNNIVILDEAETGKIEGRVFYDEDSNSVYNSTENDYPLEKIEVELVDKDGTPLYTYLPKLNENGDIIYDESGNIVYDDTPTYYRTTTDINGVYSFTGLPVSDEGTKYYVHTLLSSMQLEIQGYKLTTTKVNTSKKSGPDGNKRDSSGMSVVGEDGKTVFLGTNAQAVTLTAETNTATYKDIGYHSAFNVKDYRVTKVWADDGTEKSDKIRVKLYTCDADTADSRTAGTFLDEITLSDSSSWTYTWKNLDINRQYYMEEYYINSDGAEVLIAGTMPVYSAQTSGTYGFNVCDETQPRTKEYYGDVVSHNDAVSYSEKIDTDPNATIYKVKYTLSKDATGQTNIVTFTNSLSPYEDKEYYVWYDKESVLPNFVSKTEYNDGVKTSVPQTLSAGTETPISGMTVTSYDADVNIEGNSTTDFLYNDSTSVKFTATDDIYSEGEGTRIYIVKYNDGSTATYSFTVTIHVYNVNQDYYVLDYGLKAKLQAENAKNGTTENYKYMVLSNDTIRVDLYKSSSHPIMNSCADFAGICYSPNGLVNDVSSLNWQDTKNNSSVTLESKNGKLSVNLSKGRTTATNKGDDHANYAEIVFTPTTFMSDIDVFYYKIVVYGENVRDGIADSEIDATNGVIMYAPIIVLPASTVYYEDGYRFSTTYSSKDFEITGTDVADETFQSISTDEHYGYDKAYLDPNGTTAGNYDSLGSTTNVESKSSNFTFEFTGTGFDVLGRTDSSAAKLTYRVEKMENGAYKLKKAGTVDASYVDTNDTILRQLPVISVKDLDYGQYRIKVSLTITSTGTYHFNLDGIRTYDPLGKNGSEYYIDGERQATVESVRNMVLGTLDPELITDGFVPSDATAAIIYSNSDDGSYHPGSTVTEIRSASSIVNHSEDLDDYLTVGPKCELYIPAGSGIAFAATSDGSTSDNTLQIEVKAIFDGDDSGYGRLRNVKANQSIPVNSSTSMYYTLNTSFISASDNIVILVNDSDHTVSVSNLKYKGYVIAYPENFTKADTGASTSVKSENWAEGKDVINDKVIVQSANFATSYTRAGKYVDINETILEVQGDSKAKYEPIIFDENGNAIELSESSITPVRDFNTQVDAEDGSKVNAKGFVYRIRLLVPEDATELNYTVGAISRSQIDSSYVYSSNGWNIGITVKSADIALTKVKISTASSNMMRVTITSDEPISTDDVNWTQIGEKSMYSYFEEEGNYAVTLKDIDGYESQAVVSVVQASEKEDSSDNDDDDAYTRARDFFVNVLKAIFKFFLKMFGI